MSDGSRLWAVTSGWEGPFQQEEVLVAAADAEAALAAAERAFATAGQPICRAKMLIADAGALGPGLVVGPRRSGERLPLEWIAVDRRCGPPGG